MPAQLIRSPLAVTLDVWKALFLREAVARISADRVAWLWLILEPASHVVLMMLVFAGFRHRAIAGADPALFIMLGVLGFFLSRNVMIRGMEGVAANKVLFAYRQVKPVDTVLVRAGVEGLVVLVITVLMLVGAGLLGYPVLPADPGGALAALVMLWMAGLGLGLVLSVAGHLVPELARIARLLTTPLYFLSAVLYPSVALPHGLREVLLANPFVHGLESLRRAFMPGYQVPPGLDLAYLAAFGLVTVCLGLALHVRYRTRLIAK
jgi:capsular polysaccharide transport system permease protein